MSNVATFLFLVSCLVLSIIVFGFYDISLCPESAEFFNETIGNQSSVKATELLSHASSMKCSGVPSYIHWGFYLVISAGLIYAVLPLK